MTVPERNSTMKSCDSARKSWDSTKNWTQDSTKESWDSKNSTKKSWGTWGGGTVRRSLGTVSTAKSSDSAGKSWDGIE